MAGCVQFLAIHAHGSSEAW